MVKILNRTLLAIVLLFASLSNAMATANTLTATVSSNQVTQAEVFQLRLTYDGKVDSDSIDFSVLQDHFFLGQPSFGSSLNYVNGKRSSYSEWTIALKAKQLGTVTIPAFSINDANSQPITLRVSQDKDLPKASELVTIQSQLDKTTLYPNETTQLKTRLLIKSDPRRLQDVRISPPSGDGFSVEQVGQPNQYQTVVNGVEATVVDQTFKIMATTSGSHTLKSLAFEATFVFGSNRSGTTKLLPVTVAPEQLPIEVKAKPTNSDLAWLPTSGLTLEQQWLDDQGNPIDHATQPVQLKVGDSITRQLTLTIQGIEAANFPSIELSYPNSVRHYSEKPQFKTLVNGQTKMTLRTVLIAQQEGQTALPPVSIEWFDTTTETTKQSQVTGLNLMVEPADNITVNPIISAPNNNSSEVIRDSGYWPYLTLMFALLWLTTLLWHLKSGKIERSAHKLTQNQVEGIQQLIATIESADSIKTHYSVTQWLTSQKGKNDELTQRIEAELSSMAAHQYSKQPQRWDNRELIRLLKQLNKQISSSQKNNNLTKL